MSRTFVDFEKIRGDSWSRSFAIQYENGDPVPITDAVVRFTVKRRESDQNSDAVIRLSNYTRGVSITDAAQGLVLVEIQAGDDAALGGTACLRWDLEVQRVGAILFASPGDSTMSVEAGSDVVTFDSEDVAEGVNVGAILVCQGSTSANQKSVPVVATPATDSTLEGNELRVDYSDFDDELAANFTLRQANVKTPDKAMGDFNIIADVSR